MLRKFTCIMCPKGCEITAEYERVEADGAAAASAPAVAAAAPVAGAECSAENAVGAPAVAAAGAPVVAVAGVPASSKTVKILKLEGNGCKKGKEYVTQELTNPMRNIASSVLIEGGDLPLASCRLNKPIPKARIFDVMAEIRKVVLPAPVAEGDVVIENVLGLGADVIITKTVDKV